MYALPMFTRGLRGFEYRLPHPLTRPGVSEGCAVTGSAHVKLDSDASGLFPYLHTVAEHVRCHTEPVQATFVYEDVFCTLHPQQLVAAPFRSEGEAREFIARLGKLLEDLAERRPQLKPDYTCHQPVPILNLLRALPRTNCGDCDFPTCTAFAVAVSRGDATPEKCPHMPPPVRQATVYPVFGREGNLAGTVAVGQDSSPGPDPSREVEPAPDRCGLTDREIEVLQLLALGATNPEIATALGITPHTVKSHVTHIFNKLTVDDRTQAAVRAVRLGLV